MILTTDLPALDELVSLYASVGWDDDVRDPRALERAVRQSSAVVCARSEAGEVLGLIRVLSDDVTVCFVQDLVVRAESGSAQTAFYGALGLKKTRETQVNCFYRSTRH